MFESYWMTGRELVFLKFLHFLLTLYRDPHFFFTQKQGYTCDYVSFKNADYPETHTHAQARAHANVLFIFFLFPPLQIPSFILNCKQSGVK